jgi:hypothetical protein
MNDGTILKCTIIRGIIEIFRIHLSHWQILERRSRSRPHIARGRASRVIGVIHDLGIPSPSRSPFRGGGWVRPFRCAPAVSDCRLEHHLLRIPFPYKSLTRNKSKARRRFGSRKVRHLASDVLYHIVALVRGAEHSVVHGFVGITFTEPQVDGDTFISLVFA